MITSTRHPLVRTFREVAARPGRDPHGRILLDGARLIGDALEAGVPVEAALVAAGPGHVRLAPLTVRLREAGARVHEASERVVQAAGDVVTSQGIVALARRPEPGSERGLDAPDLVLLIADGIADPGNLGTMIRTAAAAGATAVAVTGAGADPYLPKTLRAGMGATFRIPIIETGASELIHRLAERRVPVFVADARATLEYFEARLVPPMALVIGSEATGPDPAWGSAGTTVRIPLVGSVESLNAAIAAAILLYEVVRRRGAGADGGTPP